MEEIRIELSLELTFIFFSIVVNGNIMMKTFIMSHLLKYSGDKYSGDRYSGDSAGVDPKIETL
mgnify:FL=1